MAHRRARGEGQVNWDGLRNTYVAVVNIEKNEATGKWRTKTRYASVKGKTRAGYLDGEAKLQELKDEICEQAVKVERASDPAFYTLWQCITDWHAWVTTTPKTGQKTADKYLGQCRKWVKPRLGDMPLDQVDVAALSDMLEEIAPLLSSYSLQDILGSIRRSVNYARRRRIIGYNEADAVELPQAGVKPREWDFLTQDEVQCVLDSCKGTRMHALMMLGFQTGMRPGEIRALRWSDIDYRQGVVYVVHYLKTKSSRRGLPVSDPLALALKYHQEQGWGGDQAVFVREDGQELDSDALSHRTGAVFRKAGFPHLEDAYVMRHTFASIMDHRGVKDQLIADMMGHANVTTFKKIYRHRLNPVVTETAGLMNDIWGSAA